MCRPLHFFPKSSYAYAEHMKKTGNAGRAMQEAGKAWSGGWKSNGESEDAAIRICFAGTDPLDDEFRELAMTVYGPLLDSLEAGKW
jgi:exodeoxyribonuclease V gamma subunit